MCIRDRIKADSDDKYVLVHATGNINETDVKVFDYDNADIKNICLLYTSRCV